MKEQQKITRKIIAVHLKSGTTLCGETEKSSDPEKYDFKETFIVGFHDKDTSTDRTLKVPPENISFTESITPVNKSNLVIV